MPTTIELVQQPHTVYAQRAIPKGTFTVCFKDGDNRTIRIGDGFDDKPNSQIASFLSGPDNESSFTGFATIEGSRITIWTRFRGESRTVIRTN